MKTTVVNWIVIFIIRMFHNKKNGNFPFCHETEHPDSNISSEYKNQIKKDKNKKHTETNLPLNE